MFKKYVLEIGKLLNIPTIKLITTKYENGHFIAREFDVNNLYYVKDDSKGLELELIDGKDIGEGGLVSPANFIASFRLVQLVGCCGICISTGAFVANIYRNKGVGKLLNKLRIKMAEHLGYSILMCTDVDGNKPQRNVLINNEWKDIYQFKNGRTGNTVNITIKELKPILE